MSRPALASSIEIHDLWVSYSILSKLNEMVVPESSE